MNFVLQIHVIGEKSLLQGTQNKVAQKRFLSLICEFSLYLRLIVDGQHHFINSSCLQCLNLQKPLMSHILMV